MPGESFFDPVVARYIQQRVARETAAHRGIARLMAQKTGLSQEHISNLGDGTRSPGRKCAVGFAKYWGLTHTELQRMAHEEVRSATPPSSHPELEAALAYCRGIFPEPFLLEFEQKARRARDQPRATWLGNVHSRFPEWLRSHTSPSPSQDLLLPELSFAEPKD